MWRFENYRLLLDYQDAKGRESIGKFQYFLFFFEPFPKIVMNDKILYRIRSSRSLEIEKNDDNARPEEFESIGHMTNQ